MGVEGLPERQLLLRPRREVGRARARGERAGHARREPHGVHRQHLLQLDARAALVHRQPGRGLDGLEHGKAQPRRRAHELGVLRRSARRRRLAQAEVLQEGVGQAADRAQLLERLEADAVLHDRVCALVGADNVRALHLIGDAERGELRARDEDGQVRALAALADAARRHSARHHEAGVRVGGRGADARQKGAQARRAVEHATRWDLRREGRQRGHGRRRWRGRRRRRGRRGNCMNQVQRVERRIKDVRKFAAGVVLAARLAERVEGPGSAVKRVDG